MVLRKQLLEVSDFASPTRHYLKTNRGAKGLRKKRKLVRKSRPESNPAKRQLERHFNRTVDSKDQPSQRSYFSLQNIKLRFDKFRNKKQKRFSTGKRSRQNSGQKKADQRVTLFSGDRLTRNRSISLLDLKLLGLVQTPVESKLPETTVVKIEPKWNDIILPLSIQKKVYEVWEELGDCVAFLYTGSKAHNVKKKDKIKTLLVRYYKNNFSDYNRQKILDRLVNIRKIDEPGSTRSVLDPVLKNIMQRDELILRDEFNLISAGENRLDAFQTTFKNRYIFPSSVIQLELSLPLSRIPASVVNAYVSSKFAGLERSKLNSDREVLQQMQAQLKRGRPPAFERTGEEGRAQRERVKKRGKNLKKKRKKKRERNETESKFIYEEDFFEEIQFADLSEPVRKKRDRKDHFLFEDRREDKEMGDTSIYNESNNLESEYKGIPSEPNSFILSEQNSKLSLNKALGNLGIENDQGLILKTQVFK